MCADNFAKNEEYVNLEKHPIFIDLDKTYDTVPVKKLFSILVTTNTIRHYVYIVKKCKEAKSVIKIAK